MNWSRWIRQIHRWLSVVFTLAVLVVTVALSTGKPPAWLSYIPLPPLFLLLFTGLYLFIQPYTAKWRSGGKGENA